MHVDKRRFFLFESAGSAFTLAPGASAGVCVQQFVFAYYRESLKCSDGGAAEDGGLNNFERWRQLL